MATAGLSDNNGAVQEQDKKKVNRKWLWGKQGTASRGGLSA